MLRSTRQHFYCSTCPQMYLFITLPVQFICSFSDNIHNYLSTHLLICTQIYPKIKSPVYLHASLLSNHKDLPVTTTTCVHAHRCTRSGPYPFIFILSFRLTAKIKPSTNLLLYMSTDVPVHHYTCSVCFFFFGITYTRTFQLVYWGTYPQIHQKINLPDYLHASLLSNHKDLPVTTTICVPALRCTR